MYGQPDVLNNAVHELHSKLNIGLSSSLWSIVSGSYINIIKIEYNVKLNPN